MEPAKCPFCGQPLLDHSAVETASIPASPTSSGGRIGSGSRMQGLS